MVFCHEWLQVGDGQICAIPMSDDLGEAIGDPVILFRASDGKWNAKCAKERRLCDRRTIFASPSWRKTYYALV